MKTSLYFHHKFCQRCADAGLSKKELVPTLRKIRAKPTSGAVINSRRSASREWIFRIPGRGIYFIHYVYLDEFDEVEVSTVFAAAAFETGDPIRDRVERMKFVARVGGMLAREFVISLLDM